jgi:hypothetical protein
MIIVKHKMTTKVISFGVLMTIVRKCDNEKLWSYNDLCKENATT